MSEQTPENIQGLIRQFCDGELDPARAAEIDRRLESEPDLADRVRFERTFRLCLGRAMKSTDEKVPAELVPRILAALRSAEMPAAEGTSNAFSDEARPSKADRTEAEADPLREPWSIGHWFAGPARANIFAVAATIAVIAGAVLFGIFGRPIDSIRPLQVEPATEIAQFVSTEHRRCAGSPDVRGRKTEWTGASDSAAGLRALLGVDVPIFEIDSYRFIGAGGCHIPGEPVSAHLVYAREEAGRDGCPSAMMSLFVVPNHGQFERAVAGGQKWAWSKIGDRPECAKTVASCDDGRLIYFLVCCNDFELPALAAEISREGIARTGG